MHEWKNFNIDDWNKIASVVGRNVIRDENFERQRYSNLGLKESGVSTSDLTQEVSNHAMEVVEDTSEVIDLSEEIALLKSQYGRESHRSPELLQHLQQLW